MCYGMMGFMAMQVYTLMLPCSHSAAQLERHSPAQCDHKAQLSEWTRRPKTAQALVLRARIVLLSAQGRSNTEIARRLHISLPTAGKWRQRFLDQRLDGLLDEPRPGRTVGCVPPNSERGMPPSQRPRSN